MLRAFAVVAALLCAASAGAQDFPSKPLRLICAFPPGGPVDVTSRALARELTEQLGQPVLVENRPGAGGNIGAEAAARSAPDGYTLFINWNALHAVSPLLYTKLNYDPNQDLAPVTTLVSFRQVLVVHPDLGAKSVRDLVALARAKPGTLTFASPGNGTVSHMAGTMFGERIGAKIVHVPYKGSAPALTDLVAGRVTMMFDHIPSVLPQIKAGKLRGLATSGRQRDPALPDLPTMEEAGVAGFETSVWFGLTVPAGTPGPIVARLNREAVKAARAPDFVRTMSKLGYHIVTSTPEEMAATLKEEIERWGPVVKASGARVD
ncbi:MAG TPA: tripartite tricarboxylate transporter substrate binding protein [Burkholderiales bacterium]